MEKQAFLARLRQAGGSGEEDLRSPSGSAVTTPATWTRAAARPADALGLFAARLRELGVVVREADDLERACRDADELCAARGWHAIDCDPELCRGGLAARRVDDPRQAEFGISHAAVGIAETGSVIVKSGAGRRSTSILPPASGFVVRAADVVPDLAAALRDLAVGDGALPACVTLVSGPSNTADIAGQLVIGAHGPAEVFVWILVGETAPETRDTA